MSSYIIFAFDEYGGRVARARYTGCSNNKRSDPHRRASWARAHPVKLPTVAFSNQSNLSSSRPCQRHISDTGTILTLQNPAEIPAAAAREQHTHAKQHSTTRRACRCDPSCSIRRGCFPWILPARHNLLDRIPSRSSSLCVHCVGCARVWRAACRVWSSC